MSGINNRFGLLAFIFSCLVLVSASLFSAADDAAVDAGLPLTAAKAALDDGYPELTVRLTEEFLAASDDAEPEAVQNALLLLGSALIEMDKPSQVERVLRKYRNAVKQLPQQAVPELLRAEAALVQSEHEDAIALLRPLAESAEKIISDEIQMRIWRNLAAAFDAAGDLPQAVVWLKKIDVSYGDSDAGPANLLLLAETLQRIGDTEEAQRVYARLTSRPATFPEVREGLFRQSLLAVSAGQTNLAENLLKRLVENEAISHSRKARAWLMLGRLYAAGSERGNAVHALEQVQVLAEDSGLQMEAGFDLGLLLLAQGRPDDARKHLHAYITAHPNDPRSAAAQLRLADVLRQAGKHEDAISAYQHYLESFPENNNEARAHEGRGWSLLAMERFPAAAADFEKAGGLYHEDADRQRCLFKKGDAEMAAGQYVTAVDTYRKLLNTYIETPYRPRVLLQLGQCLLRLGMQKEADAVLAGLDAESNAPEFVAAALLQRGRIREKERQWKEAADFFSAVLELPEVPQAYRTDAMFARGNVRFRAFLFSEALTDFEKIIEAGDAPIRDVARFRRVFCLYWMGRDQEAVDAARQFVSQHPDSSLSPEFYYWLARHDYNQREYETARDRFLKIAESYPKHRLADDALFRAGVCAFNINEYIRAVEILARLANAYQESPRLAEGRFVQANALNQLGRYAESILIYDDILQNFKDNALMPVIWMRKGDCFFNLAVDEPERYEESLAAFRTALQYADSDRALTLEAGYKIGRCLEKLDRKDDALEQYYENVILQFLTEREQGVWYVKGARNWFARAAFNAVDLLTEQSDWRRAARILQRVVEADVPASAEAKERLTALRAKYWWLY